MQKPHQAVIFDLDGTLLDTLTDLANSGNEVLASRGLPIHSTDDYRRFIGNGMANLVQNIFPEDIAPADGPETELILVEYRAAYDRHWQETTDLFPGIADLLDSLNASNIPMGVVSNKSHDFTQKCVDAFLGRWKWAAVFGARDRVPRKPDPTGALEAARLMGAAPSDCYFVGDSDVDIFTAVNAAMNPIGVAWGFRPVEELIASGAAAVLDQPLDLLTVMKHES